MGAALRCALPPMWTPRSMRLNAASSRRSILTGARCSSAAMMAICSAHTAGGVPRFRRRPHACRPGSSFPWMLAKLLAGELVCLSSPDELPDGVDRASLLRFDLKSTVVVPLSLAQRIVGAVSFGVTRSERPWPPEILQRLRLAASLFASVLARRHERRRAPPGARRGRTLERSAARGERATCAVKSTARSALRASVRAPRFAACRSRCARSPRPTRRCSFWARPAPAKRSSRRRFMS